MLYSLCCVLCALCCLLCALHALCALCCLLCALCALCALCSVLCAVFSALSTVRCILCAVCSVLYSLCSVLCAVLCCTLCAVFSPLSTLRCILCALVLYSLRCLLYAVYSALDPSIGGVHVLPFFHWWWAENTHLKQELYRRLFLMFPASFRARKRVNAAAFLAIFASRSGSFANACEDASTRRTTQRTHGSSLPQTTQRTFRSLPTSCSLTWLFLVSALECMLFHATLLLR